MDRLIILWRKTNLTKYYLCLTQTVKFPKPTRRTLIECFVYEWDLEHMKSIFERLWAYSERDEIDLAITPVEFSPKEV